MIMTTSLPKQSASRAPIEDSGCLVSLGFFADDTIMPSAASRTSVKPQASFAIVARPAPEDPGCLGMDGLNILSTIEVPTAVASSDRFKPARTLDLSTEAWGQQELAAAEAALNTERTTQRTTSTQTRALAIV